MLVQALWLVPCVLLCNIHSAYGGFDYIVVGAGASGCTIAPELAATGKSVLVLEAGLKTAIAFGGNEKNAAFGTLKDTTVFDVPGENENIRKTRRYWWSNVPWGLNGRGIGGSGMMNAAATFIPSPDDFNSWPWGWKYHQMKPSYDATLSKLSVTTTPSSDGNLYVQGSAEAFEKMATNQLGLKKVGLNDDPNARSNTFSLNEVTAKDGKRMDACQAFLLPAMNSRSNLRLEVNAEVKRIHFEIKGVAKSVVLTDGTQYFLNAYGKLILTAGTFQTTRLLQFSGVGPYSELKRLQKDGLVQNSEQFWVFNEELGKNMHDHSFSQMTFQVPNVPDFAFRYYKFQNDPNAGSKYINEKSGPYAQYGPVRLGFMARPGSTSPDVELLVMTSGVEGTADRDCNTCFRILVMNLRPRAREPFRIKTSNMQECDCGGETCVSGDVCKPKLYLTNSDDVELLQWAYESIVQAAKNEGYTVLTPKQSDPAGIAEFLKNSGEAKFSASHWAGTCTLGKCTDFDLKIRGTTNIFVADSSIFPSPVRAHNVATVFAVAHKASSVIRDANTGLAN